MRNITNAFRRELYNDNRAYKCTITIQLTDNTELTVDESRIWQNGLVTNDNVSNESSFSALGSVIVNSGTLILNNIYDDFSSYTFDQAKVIISIGLEIDGVLESVKLGTFTVDDTNYNGALITLYCLDNMHKFDKPYSGSALVYPTTLQAIVTDACTNCGVLLQTTTFPNYNITIADRPIDEAITYREVISYAATLAGCFARCNANGKLEVKWFDRNSLDTLYSNIDGGVFDSATPYASGDSVNGGDFNPWNLGDVVDGGSFADISNVHYITALSSQDVSVDDIVITGVRINVSTVDITSTETSHLYGTEGYVISIEKNPFITTDNVDTIGTYLQNLLVGLKFRKATISHLNDPSIEAGDTALIFDRKGNIYPILVTNTTFNVSQYQRTISAATTPVKNSAVKYTETTKTLVESKKLIQQEKTLREQMGNDLNNALNAKAGMYETRVQEQGGGYTYYMHDKPLLANSTAVIKITNEAVGITPNYQATPIQWYGLTVDGNFIANIMSVIGIDFDWGTGGTLVLGGQNNTNGSLTIKDASSNTIGYWNNTGINAIAGTIGGFTITNTSLHTNNFSLQSSADSGGAYINLYDNETRTSISPYYIAILPQSSVVLSESLASLQGISGRGVLRLAEFSSGGTELNYILAARGGVDVIQNGTDTASVRVKNSVAGIQLEVDSFGNHGLYSENAGWMICYDASNSRVELPNNTRVLGNLVVNSTVTASNRVLTSVSFSSSLTSGTKIGTITIDGVSTDLYCQTNTTYSAGTGLSLSGTTFSNSGATGVKGNAESSYRTGNVNLTPANIGALALTGGTVSGSIAISATGKGFNLTDSSGTTYGGIYENGDNLWIGASSSTSPHHRGANGNLYLSAGYSTNSSKGNGTVYISVPSLSGGVWSHTSYGVLHSGNYSSYALPKSGGTLTGPLSNNGYSFYFIASTIKKGTTPSADSGFQAINWLEKDYTTTDTAGRFASLRQYLTSGNTNILQMLAYAPVAGSTTAYRLDIRAGASTGFVYTNCAIGVNKTAGTDGNAGFWANTAGNIYLTGAANAGSNIYFFYGTSTSSTARLYESASGTLRVSSAFTVDGIFRSPSTWSNTTTNSANVRVIDQYGQFQRYSSSSRRYKHDIKPIKDYRSILDIPVVTFKYNDGYISGKDQRYGLDIPGFIAEEVEKLYPIAAEWVDGKVEDWNARYIIPPMLAVEQDHEKRIAILEEENKKLMTLVNKILERI